MKEKQVPHLSIVRKGAALIISLDADSYLPAWEEIKIQVAACAFAGQDVFFITATPPLWDVELDELSSDIRTIEFTGKHSGTIAAALAPAVSVDLLQVAVSSTDFTLRDLRILVASPNEQQQTTNFALATTQLIPTEIIDTSKEYMECIDDKWLYWVNATSDRLMACIDMLRKRACVEGWHFTSP